MSVIKVRSAAFVPKKFVSDGVLVAASEDKVRKINFEPKASYEYDDVGDTASGTVERTKQVTAEDDLKKICDSGQSDSAGNTYLSGAYGEIYKFRTPKFQGGSPNGVVSMFRENGVAIAPNRKSPKFGSPSMIRR